MIFMKRTHNYFSYKLESISSDFFKKLFLDMSFLTCGNKCLLSVFLQTLFFGDLFSVEAKTLVLRLANFIIYKVASCSYFDD